ncbi:hypothetical protein [Ramlibacter sp.]|uniref:hypothetical protein n=1 Tax=Ramlibacter sp. TaxID=1917967 RepID=UPI0017DB76A9|nr:hypothetical protein [Ramlibacter sp.]MBA2673133.1 hypothetical protein [Ramlibacter sp.]
MRAKSSLPARTRRGELAAEAARNVLLRRLTPALKHDMVVNLQAVSMLTEMLGARLERGTALAQDMQSSIAKLNRLARDAVGDCLRVASWLDVADDDAVPLHQAVADCAALLTGNLNFHGFQLSNHVVETGFEVSRSGARALVAASLMLLVDTAPQHCEIMIHAEVSASDALLLLSCVPLEHEPFHAAPQEGTPLPIEWADVQALALSAGAAAARDGQQIQLRLPRAQVTSPVQMAPV